MVLLVVTPTSHKLPELIIVNGIYGTGRIESSSVDL
jgi:hypothetical protein